MNKIEQKRVGQMEIANLIAKIAMAVDVIIAVVVHIKAVVRHMQKISPQIWRSLIALLVGSFGLIVFRPIQIIMVIAALRSDSAFIIVSVSLASTLLVYFLPAIVTGIISRKQGFLHGLALCAKIVETAPCLKLV